MPSCFDNYPYPCSHAQVTRDHAHITPLPQIKFGSLQLCVLDGVSTFGITWTPSMESPPITLQPADGYARRQRESCFWYKSRCTVMFWIQVPQLCRLRSPFRSGCIRLDNLMLNGLCVHPWHGLECIPVLSLCKCDLISYQAMMALCSCNQTTPAGMPTNVRVEGLGLLLHSHNSRCSGYAPRIYQRRI